MGKEDLKDTAKLKALQWPQSAIEFARGEMGTPHFGFPEQMQDCILKGKLKPMEGRPGDSLPAEDFSKVKAAIEEEFGRSFTQEDVMAYLMYPAVFKGYMKHLTKAGPLITCIPTPAFFYGMEVGEVIEFDVPGENLADAETKDDPLLARSTAKVELVRVSALDGDDVRTVEWRVDGVSYKVKMKDPSSNKSSYSGPMAEAGNKAHISCPLPGVVSALAVSDGQELKKDDLIMTVVSMKMEVHVRAPADCVITEVVVAKDQEVVDGALLAKIKA